jgi:hypothetical protein
MTTSTLDTNGELLKAGVDAKDSAVRLFQSVKHASSLAQAVAKKQLEERPYVALSAAAGAGFVLAGGLASSITRGLVRTGTKLAAAAVVGKVIDAIAHPDGEPAAAPAPPQTSNEGEKP